MSVSLVNTLPIEAEFFNLNLTEDYTNSGKKSGKLTSIQKHLSEFVIVEEFKKDVEALVDVADGTYGISKKIINFFPSSEGPFPYVPDCVNDFFDEVYSIVASEEFDTSLTQASFAITVFTLPSAVKEVISKIKGAYEAIKDKDHEFIWDNVLSGAYESAKLLGSASEIISFLVKVEFIAKKALVALPFLGSAGVALGSLGIVKVTINTYQLHRELHTYREIIDKDREIDGCFRNVVAYVNGLSKNKAKKLFGRDQTWILERINNVQNAEDKNTVIFALRDRITATKDKNMLDMGAGFAWLGSNVAFVFAATTVAVPYLLLSAAVFSLAKDSQGWVERRNFRNIMDEVKFRSSATV